MLEKNRLNKMEIEGMFEVLNIQMRFNLLRQDSLTLRPPRRLKRTLSPSPL